MALAAYYCSLVAWRQRAEVPCKCKYKPHRLAICHPGPWLTIAQLAEHLTVDQSCGYQSVLGSIPSGEIAAEKCLGNLFGFLLNFAHYLYTPAFLMLVLESSDLFLLLW